MHVIEKKHAAKGRSFEMQFDPENKLVLVIRNDESPSFAIGWLHDGCWYYQSLMWSCRAGKKFWYRPLIAFYRYIRKHKLTDYSLRFMAWGEKRLKHGGYVIGSDTHRRYMEAGVKLAARRQREAAVSDGVKEAMKRLGIGDHWQLEVGHNGFYVLNKRSGAAGVATQCLTVKAVFDSIFVQRITGVSSRANDPDPFRNMKMRNEAAPVHFAGQDRSPEQLVDAAMTEVERLMALRCDTNGSLDSVVYQTSPAFIGANSVAL